MNELKENPIKKGKRITKKDKSI